MAGRIEGISPIQYNAGRVERVTRPTKDEIEAAFKNFDKLENEMNENFKAKKEVLEKFPNPDKLSFKEIMLESKDKNLSSGADYSVEISAAALSKSRNSN